MCFILKKHHHFLSQPGIIFLIAFGCGKKGDSITLVSELLNITPLEAAIYLNNNLGLGLNIGKYKYNIYVADSYRKKIEVEESLKKWQLERFIELTKRNRELKNIDEIFSRIFKNEPDLYFEQEEVVNYLKNKEQLEYIINEFVQLDINNVNQIYDLKKQMQKVGGYNI